MPTPSPTPSPGRNPVTRFGGGFGGFSSNPRSLPSTLGTREYGPGIGENGISQTRGPLGALRPGDVALAPNVAAGLGLHYGDLVTYNGQTFRYADGSFIGVDRKTGKDIPNSNVIEFWRPPGSGSMNENGPVAVGPRTLGDDEWVTSPGDRRYLPSPSPTPSENSGQFTGETDGSTFVDNTLRSDTINRFNNDRYDPERDGGREVADGPRGKPPNLIDDPNDDWTGTTEGTGVASGGGRPPSLIDDPNQDWTGAGGSNGMLQMGHSIASTGLMNFGGQMTIGQFLNTPLALLRSSGSVQFQPGAGRTSTPTTFDLGPDGMATGNLAVGSRGANGAIWNGTDWTKPSDYAGNNAVPSPDRADISPEPNDIQPPGQGNGPTTADTRQGSGGTTGGGGGGGPMYPAGTQQVGQGASSGQGYYRSSPTAPWVPIGQAPQEIRFDRNSGTGNWQAGEFTRSYLAGGGDPGTPNYTGDTQDTGHTIYYLNAGTPRGYADPESMGIVQRSDRLFGGGQADPRWVFPTQAESARLGLSSAGNADKFNAWLKAHNPWFYESKAG